MFTYERAKQVEQQSLPTKLNKKQWKVHPEFTNIIYNIICNNKNYVIGCVILSRSHTTVCVDRPATDREYQGNKIRIS